MDFSDTEGKKQKARGRPKGAAKKNAGTGSATEARKAASKEKKQKEKAQQQKKTDKKNKKEKQAKKDPSDSGTDESCSSAISSASSKRRKRPKAKPKEKVNRFCYCGSSRYKGFWFCQTHKNLQGVMRYRAEAQGTFENFKAAMAVEDDAVYAVKEFEKRCAGCAKFKKSGVIDWGQLTRTCGRRHDVEDLKDTAPYERDEWITKMRREKRWSKPEATAEWDRFYDSGQFKKTNTGLHGKEEMWLPEKPRLREAIIDYTDTAFVEGSSQMKRISEQDRAALKSFVAASASTNEGGFLKGNYGEEDHSEKLPWDFLQKLRNGEKDETNDSSGNCSGSAGSDSELGDEESNDRKRDAADAGLEDKK